MLVKDRPKVTLPPIRGGDGALTPKQKERRSRMVERAIKCLEADKINEFWARMDIINAYVMRVRRD